MTNVNDGTPHKRNPQHSENSDVRQLLEQAGRRPEIPEADFRVIKAAARLEWQQLVDSRKNRRKWWGLMTPLPAAAGILIVLALAFWWRTGSAPASGDSVASIELFRGDVRIEEALGGGTGSSELTAGRAIPAGAELVTGEMPEGLGAMIAVRLTNGQSLRLPGGSSARLVSDSRIELLEGSVYIDSGSAPDLSGVEISTPFGSVIDIGTQFEVRLGEANEALRIRVRTGSVSLVREGEQHSAAVGEELLVRLDGTVSRASYEPFGADWDWVLSSAPPLDIDGLALSDFLDWVATETGVEVQYEDQVLAGAATAIELHGTIEGLRPDEATTAVLPGTGLGHRIEDGVLFIRRLPAGGGGV